MASLTFEKYEGLGNDFVVVDAASDAEISTELARALCDRRRGVGADGVLVLLPAHEPGVAGRMRVINADGSVPEMCGNGLRCAALHLARRMTARGVQELAIETDAGVRVCVIEPGGEVTADMGFVSVGPDAILDVDGERVELTTADAGNPHAVLFRDSQQLRELSSAELARLGPRLATHPHFPNGANVELAVVTPAGIRVLVWERGVGPTEACGTGACAVVAVASAKGKVPSDVPVRVFLPGGELVIQHDLTSGRTTMRGPARRVFAGTVPRGS
jgi:diaminopimelate epimerase